MARAFQNPDRPGPGGALSIGRGRPMIQLHPVGLGWCRIGDPGMLRDHMTGPGVRLPSTYCSMFIYKKGNAAYGRPPSASGDPDTRSSAWRW